MIELDESLVTFFGLYSKRVTTFGHYLLSDPLNIPAFKIRDLDVPFGSDMTPLEVIAAAAIISMARHDSNGCDN